MVARAPLHDPRELTVRAALEEIADPEIPTISVVELGVIGEVAFEPRREGGERLSVELLPTFVGCPAIDVMQQQIGERLTALDVADEVEVRLTFTPPWTSDRITERGRDRLARSGFAPPAAPDDVRCPYCASERVAMDSAFGPTQCRSLFYCRACRQPFEAFKPI